MNILITGASRGIGRAIVFELSKSNKTNECYTFYSLYNKNMDAMREVHIQIIKDKNISFPFQANVADRKAVISAIEYFKKESTFKVDVLINNAGILRDRTLKKMTDEEWDECIGVNLTGIYNVTKAVLPYMNQGGRIINITSMSGITGNFGQTNYASAKAGVIGFTKSLAKELGRNNIRVNVVVVGLCETDMSKSIPEVAIQSFVDRMPLKRMSKPEEIARLVRYIAFEDTYCTGAIFDASGGIL